MNDDINERFLNDILSDAKELCILREKHGQDQDDVKDNVEHIKNHYQARASFFLTEPFEEYPDKKYAVCISMYCTKSHGCEIEEFVSQVASSWGEALSHLSKNIEDELTSKRSLDGQVRTMEDGKKYKLTLIGG